MKIVVALTAMNEVSGIKLASNFFIDLPKKYPSIEIETYIVTAPGADAEFKNILNDPKIIESFSGVFVQNSPPGVGSGIKQFIKSEYCETLDWFIMAAADGETPFYVIYDFVNLILNESQVDVIQASRWEKNESGFVDYSTKKLIANRISQILCQLLFTRKINDYTYGFRAINREFLFKSNYQEDFQPFFLESLVIPLRLGAKVLSVPAVWQGRSESKSSLTVKNTFLYLRPLLKSRFSTKSRLMKYN